MNGTDRLSTLMYLLYLRFIKVGTVSGYVPLVREGSVMGAFMSSISALLVVMLSSVSISIAAQNHCARFSDPFDVYHPERWQEVLLYSHASGDFAIRDGHLMLRSPKGEPCEVEVYSLFTFAGDFDIQVDYDLIAEEGSESCRFNAGVVLQTLGDEKSYKCYVAMKPGKESLFRARLDRFGEQNVEKYKGHPAPPRGALKVVRTEGHIRFLALLHGKWRKIYDFRQPCPEKLRLRFKLQTGNDEDARQACPVQVSFDNFTVNSCTEIREE